MLEMNLPNAGVTQPEFVLDLIDRALRARAEFRRGLRQPDEHTGVQQKLHAIPQAASSSSDRGAKQSGLHFTDWEVISPTLGR